MDSDDDDSKVTVLSKEGSQKSSKMPEMRVTKLAKRIEEVKQLIQVLEAAKLEHSQTLSNNDTANSKPRARKRGRPFKTTLFVSC